MKKKKPVNHHDYQHLCQYCCLSPYPSIHLTMNGNTQTKRRQKKTHDEAKYKSISLTNQTKKTRKQLRKSISSNQRQH